MRCFTVFSVLLFLGVLSLPQVVAQTPLADSLRAILPLERNPQREVDLMNDIAYALFDVDDSTALVFAQRAANAALQAGYEKGLKRAITYIGVGNVSKGNFVSAIRYYHYADTVKAKAAEELTIYNYTMMSNAFRDLAQFDSAEYYQKLALTRARAYGKPKPLAMTYKNYALLLIHRSRFAEALDALRVAQENLNQDYEHYLQAEIWAAAGKAYLGMLQYQKAGEYFTQMCSLANILPDKFLKIKCQLNLADLALAQSRYSAALEHAFKGFNLVQHYVYPPQQADLYHRIGTIYTQMGQFELAARYLFEALKITESKQLKQRQGAVLGDLAWVYKELNNLPLALQYINRSLEVRQSIADLYGVAWCHNVRGLIYLQQKKYKEALAELEMARSMREQIGHLDGLAATTFNIGLVYDEMGQYEKALTFKLKAAEMAEGIVNPHEQCILLNSMARSFIQLKRYSEALSYLEKAQSIAASIQAPVLLKDVYQTFADYYQATGNLQQAVAYLRSHQQLVDSLYTTSTSAKLAELQALYQLEEKEQQIRFLQQEKALNDTEAALRQSQINNLRIVLAAGLLVLVLVSTLTWAIYKSHKDLQRAHREIKEKHEEIQSQAEELIEANQNLSRLNRQLAEKQEEIQAQAEELLEANQTIQEINRNLEAEVQKRTQELKQAYTELDTFFYRSSHDFRRPLTTFMGLAEVAKITVTDPHALELFNKVRETAMSLDRMLVKLQSISDVGVQEYDYREVLAKELFDSLCDNWREEINRKNIVITSESQLTHPFYSYPALIKIIIENLLENAIQFSAPENPRIHFSVHEGEGFVVLELSDNGHGIPTEYHHKVFDMYFRGSHYSKGNGLGLYIVKKAVEKLNGEIMFTSAIDKGTTFSVRLSRNARITTVVV